MKFDLRAWTFNGVKMVPLHTIVRRLVCFPFLYAARALLAAVALIGWGTDQSARVWNDTK